MGKHVIILGAGASYTSGYPLAADLRVLLSSVGTLEEYLNLRFQPVHSNYASCQFLKNWFTKQSGSLRLFREGCFGTVDEFSFLAGKTYPKEVHQIKQTVGLILALHSPEIHFKTRTGQMTSGFETSDYYTFVQRLFRESNKVRDDVVVLTYNYDPYLDYLLYRSYRRRREASGEEFTEPPTELTSGFSDRNSDSIREGKGFCFLKLHGTAVLPPQRGFVENPPDHPLSYKEVFWGRDDWFNIPGGQMFNSNPSPAMYFPWELLDEHGEFIGKEKFSGLEDLGAAPYFNSDQTLHDLCKAIWERARSEITQAEKISFVGLSMHKFLEGGLRFLFAERAKIITNEIDSSLEIIMACPDSRYPGAKFSDPAPPNSLADRLAETLYRVYPKARKGSSSGCLMAPKRGKQGIGGIVCYEDFESFIRFEL